MKRIELIKLVKEMHEAPTDGQVEAIVDDIIEHLQSSDEISSYVDLVRDFSAYGAKLKVVESTEVIFDLAKELGEKDFEEFKKSAGNKDLTEHFLDITIRNKESAA